MNPHVPPTITIDQYLSGEELPTPSHPLTWDETKAILTTNQHANVHLAVASLSVV